jgi:hypothetical protein
MMKSAASRDLRKRAVDYRAMQRIKRERMMAIIALADQLNESIWEGYVDFSAD